MLINRRYTFEELTSEVEDFEGKRLKVLDYYFDRMMDNSFTVYERKKD